MSEGTHHSRLKLHLARMHANPPIKHIFNSAWTNMAWDKHKTPISLLKPPDLLTETDLRMHKKLGDFSEHLIIALESGRSASTQTCLAQS